MNKIQLFFDEGQPFEYANIKHLMGLAGLYLIYNTQIEIQYPFRKSKLIYIGMSERKTNSIGKRLQGHLEGSSGNEGIINYKKVNQLNFTYINFEMLRTKWPLNIESLESFFILNFVKHYGVYPICNNKSGYNIMDQDVGIDIQINWENFE
ncbi:MAG: hypothetical protein PHC34_13475 [Candidatus Gastranaerophilales bacterium]|nr:hypothetical protein [Candidatus Gastranaerophilales bacterium]